MAGPKRRTPRARRNSRRANHDNGSAPNTNPCANCGEPMTKVAADAKAAAALKARREAEAAWEMAGQRQVRCPSCHSINVAS